MNLPPLLIDRNLQQMLAMCSEIQSTSGPVIALSGQDVVTLEPVGACLLAMCSRKAALKDQRIEISGMRSPLRAILRDFSSGITFADDAGDDGGESKLGASVSRHVQTARQANAAANDMANYMAQFIPAEDRLEMSQDNYGLRIHHAVQPAIAYILSELLDNVFCHAATTDFREPNAWVAVQSYPAGDLMRVAVVDDGCGFLGSLRGLPENPPKNHFEATTRAFQPFLTSKGVPLLYAERRHMGLGLPVCNAISRSLDGFLHAASGNAWVERPNSVRQVNRTADAFFQGTIVALELHRRGATPNLLRDVLATFSGSADLRLRFD